MKQLSVEATGILNKMVGMMEDFCFRVENSEGSYIPVYVDLFNIFGNRIIRVGHYTSVGGDIIADPEMRFIYNERMVFRYSRCYTGVDRNSQPKRLHQENA
jgi:hypothetical protein